MFAEMVVEQVARRMGKPDHAIREINMYKEVGEPACSRGWLVALVMLPLSLILYCKADGHPKPAVLRPQCRQGQTGVH